MWSNVVMVDVAVARADEEENISDGACCHGDIVVYYFLSFSKCSLHILQCVLISGILHPINAVWMVKAFLF